MKKLDQLISKALNEVVDFEIFGWPPACIGIIYQPERPEKPEENMEK